MEMTTTIVTFIGTAPFMTALHAEQTEWQQMIRNGWPKTQIAICYQPTLTPGRPPMAMYHERTTCTEAQP